MDVLAFLKSQGLTQEARIRTSIDAGAEEDIQAFLEGYQRAAIATPLSPNPEFSTSVYLDTWSATAHLKVVTQLALLLDRIYIPDPTLSAVHDLAQVHLQPDGEARQRFFDALRSRLGRSIRVVNSLAPLISDGVVSLIPSAVVGPVRSPGAMYADDFMDPDGITMEEATLRSVIPEAIRTILADIMDVVPARHDPDTGEVEPLDDDSPARTLILGFDGDPLNTVRHFYEVQDVSEDGHVGALHVPDLPMDPVQHLNWRQSERLKLALRRWLNIQFDLATAMRLNSRLLTPFPATRAMIEAASGARSGYESEVTRLLSLELPYFDKVRPSYLAKARKEEIAFDAFRTALRQALKALASIKPQDLSPAELEEQRADVLRNLVELPLRNVRVQMKRIARRRGVNIVLGSGALASLLAGNLTGSAPIVSAGAGGLGAAVFNWVKGVLNDSSVGAVRDSSGYFYWTATGRSK